MLFSWWCLMCVWRSNLSERALEALGLVADSLGAVSWARYGAQPSKQLAAIVPKDIVVSTDDFEALMQGPALWHPEVRYAHTWLLNTVSGMCETVSQTRNCSS